MSSNSLREKLARVIGLGDEDDDPPISVDELLLRGRQDMAEIQATLPPDSSLPQRGPVAALVRTIAQMPKIVGPVLGNDATLDSLRRIAANRQPLLLLADKRRVEQLRSVGSVALHLPGFRTTRALRSWLGDVASLANGTYLLLTDADIARWNAFFLTIELRKSQFVWDDLFITHWPGRPQAKSIGLESAINQAICCSVLPSYEEVEGIERSEALALLFIDRFADDLKRSSKFLPRVARLAASRGHTFKQALFEKCLVPHGVAVEAFDSALRQAAQQFDFRRYHKKVEVALSI